MSTQIALNTAQPQAFGPRGPAIRVRRFGQNDFERFDEENAVGHHLCVGEKTISKVNIECKYRWRQSQWGLIGTQSSPAGIIYMDILFHQPDGFWLESATVYVTIGEDEHLTYALGKPKKERRSQRHAHSPEQYRLGDLEYSVQMSEHYGPKLLTGTKTLRQEVKTSEFLPTLGVMGMAELGGVGHRSSYVQERVDCWKFQGNVVRPQGQPGFRTLRWDLTENKFEPNQPHSPEYHTAFAFEHSRRPMYMRVEIEGKLKSRSQRIFHRTCHFSSAMGNKDNSTLTHMDLRRLMPLRRLDEVARGLDMAMQMKNCEKVPVQVPGPRPARFSSWDSYPAVLNQLPGKQGVRADQDEGRGGCVGPLIEVLSRQLNNSLSPKPPSSESLELAEAKDDSDMSTFDDIDSRSPTLVNSESPTTAAATVPSLPYQPRAAADSELLKNTTVIWILSFMASASQLFGLFRRLFFLEPCEATRQLDKGNKKATPCPRIVEPQELKQQACDLGLERPIKGMESNLSWMRSMEDRENSMKGTSHNNSSGVQI
ncbi:uncharacterized protein PgNI_03105 [Pyricularia grisea]|uniref:Uncharacterized protein n=1 Tax=Pyricularia grisea TaxID=148305 RepID=A0A6P8BE34_PYRGI|nr:uncharacterized protein PgNI_03105 [Pyricularia grisea]TLD14083.1 hypothetical protein PgNI_03105 [Pyricularia grisea]